MFMPKGSTAGLPADRKGIMRGYGPDIVCCPRTPQAPLLSVIKG